MSKQIKSELRTYMSYLDTQVAPTTIDEITELPSVRESVRPIGAHAQSTDLRPRRPWIIAVTSAAAALLLVGGATWLTQVKGSDTPVADIVVHGTSAATENTTQSEGAAWTVFGQFDNHYWEAPLCGDQQCIDEGQMDMSDERLNGKVTFIHNGAAWETEPLGWSYLYWGTMLIENDGGMWEGTHFAADHHSQPYMHGPIVMQLVGSGQYEGLSAILYKTIISPPGTNLTDLKESVDGMIFPGDLPPDRR